MSLRRGSYFLQYGGRWHTSEYDVALTHSLRRRIVPLSVARSRDTRHIEAGAAKWRCTLSLGRPAPDTNARSRSLPRATAGLSYTLAPRHATRPPAPAPRHGVAHLNKPPLSHLRHSSAALILRAHLRAHLVQTPACTRRAWPPHSPTRSMSWASMWLALLGLPSPRPAKSASLGRRRVNASELSS